MPEFVLQPGSERVEDTVGKRKDENVRVGELELDEVCGDHLAYRVRVGQATEERKGHEMVLQDVGLQQQVGNDQSPGHKEGQQSDQCIARAVATGATCLDNIAARLDRVETQHHEALDHVPVGKGHVVDEVGDKGALGHAQCLHGRVCPDVTTAKVAGGGKDGADDQDAFDGAVDDSESEGLGVVLVPSLYVKGEKGYRVC